MAGQKHTEAPWSWSSLKWEVEARKYIDGWRDNALCRENAGDVVEPRHCGQGDIYS